MTPPTDGWYAADADDADRHPAVRPGSEAQRLTDAMADVLNRHTTPGGSEAALREELARAHKEIQRLRSAAPGCNGDCQATLEWLHTRNADLRGEVRALRATPVDDVPTLLVALSKWIDSSNTHRDSEAVMWGRVSKVGEEFGEVIAAVVGWTGQNPRKGTTHTQHDVVEELLDVALTALCAVEHLNEHDCRALDLLADKVRRVAARAAQPPPAADLPAQGGTRPVEPWVQAMVRAAATGQPLDFDGAAVPQEVQHALRDALAAARPVVDVPTGGLV